MAALSVSEAAAKSSLNRNHRCCSSKAAESEYEFCFLFVLCCTLLLLLSILRTECCCPVLLLLHHHDSLSLVLVPKITPAPLPCHNHISKSHPIPPSPCPHAQPSHTPKKAPKVHLPKAALCSPTHPPTPKHEWLHARDSDCLDNGSSLHIPEGCPPASCITSVDPTRPSTITPSHPNPSEPLPPPPPPPPFPNPEDELPSHTRDTMETRETNA